MGADDIALTAPGAELGPARSPVDLAVAVWLDSKARRSGSAKTRQSYATTLAEARAGLASVGLDLDGEPRAVALALQGWCSASKRGTELRPATVAHRLAVVSSFYDFALRRGLLESLTSNPAHLVERPRVESYATAQPLEPARVRRALTQLRRESAGEGEAAELAARDLALLNVALTTGRRAAELVALRWRDVEVTGGGGITLTFQRAKGGKVMRDALALPAAADLIRWLRRHYGARLGDLPPDAALWPSLRRGRPSETMTHRGVAQLVERRLGVSPHKLRHTFAHGMEAEGAKVSEVQARLGHASLATTSRYLAALDRAENPYAGRLFELFNRDDNDLSQARDDEP